MSNFSTARGDSPPSPQELGKTLGYIIQIQGEKWGMVFTAHINIVSQTVDCPNCRGIKVFL